MMKARRKIRRSLAAVNTGLYIHSSPPAVVQPHPSIIRQWLRGGEVDKLEDVILHGQGHKLLGEYSSDLKVRAFLKTVPAYLARIDMINDAVVKGNLIDLQALLQPTSASGVPRKRISSLALCRDQSGNGILHKAIYYGYTEMAEWLVEHFPLTIHIRDREKRTPLHYCGSSEDTGYIWTLLTEAGAEPNVVDKQGHTPSYYIDHPEELRLPSTPTNMPTGRFTSGRNGIVIKQSNIRIWIHDRDLGRLQQVVWEGHGAKLKTETSHQPTVRKFLNAIPYIMGTIKETHSAVVKNDLTFLKKKTEDPVPKQIFNSKDANGLTPLHKAAGLGYTDIAQYILDRYPNAISTKDHEGRTALHYAAILKDNGEMYNLLKEYRADDAIMDKKGKTASYYIQKPNEIDSKLLTVIPEAPRTASIAPASWDWRLLNQDLEDATDLSPKPPPTNSLNGDSAFEDMGQDESDKLSPQTLPNSEEGLDQETTDDYPSQKYDIYQQDVDEGVGYEPEEFQDSQEIIETNSDPPPDNYKTENQAIRDDESTEENPRSPLYEEVDESSNNNEDLQPEVEEIRNDENTREESKSAASNSSVIRDKIQTGSMEQLAEMVLRGEGQSLLTYKSDDPDVQMFLNNVPSYMAKIEAVHSATREGNLRALQYALDRRKFAVARENQSPLRLTPLHVAALYNRTSVLRFLAGRFPETLYARDLKGRTPLHYAATLRDNAHFYNLLITLGADKNFEDEDGKTAEYYLHNPDHVTHDQLLAEYERLTSGEHPVTSTADELSDKVENDTVSSRRNNDDTATLATLERFYQQLNRPLDATDSFYKLLNQYLTLDVFEKLKLRLTKLDHSLLDIIRPIFNTNKTRNDFASINIPDYESLIVFEELLLPLTKAMNGIPDAELERHPNSNFLPDDGEKYVRLESLNLDRTGRILQSCRIECCRNLQEFSFPINLTLPELENIENDLTTVLFNHYKTKDKTVKPEYFVDDITGAYCSVCETLQMDSEIYKQLEFYDLLDPELEVEKHHGKYWPHGRGVYINPNGNITVWINIQEHLKVIITSTEDDKGRLGSLYKKLAELMIDLQYHLKFKRDDKLGFISTDLYFLGNGLKFSAVLNLPHLGEDLYDLQQLCDVRGLIVEVKTGLNVFAVRNKRSLGVTEYDAFENFTSAVSNIVDLERNKTRAKAAKLTKMIGNFIGKM